MGIHSARSDAFRLTIRSMKDPKKAKPRPRETSAPAVKVALLRKLARLTDAAGEIRLPCAPSMADEHAKTLNAIFEQLGRGFSPAEMTQLKANLVKELTLGFQKSQYSKLVVTYNTEPHPHPGIQYRITTAVSTVGDEYERWVATRDPPLFGKHPDAKVMRLAAELGAPAEVPILDVGAGTGRNTLPLARLGYPTEAVEIAPALAAELRTLVKAEKLPVGVFEGDILDPVLVLPEAKYKLIVLAEVVASHFRDENQLRGLAARSADLLAPGGLLLFSAFTSLDGYKPELIAREMSQVTWCTIFTRGDIERSFQGLPLEHVSEESVHDYEHEHLPAEAWPPTGWFANWTQGADLFDLPPGRAPLELRWFTYRRK